jgi:ribosomal protein S18 acetylase RimI-like enzyme
MENRITLPADANLWLNADQNQRTTGIESNFLMAAPITETRKMLNIAIINREIAPSELERVHAGFDEHTLDNGAEVQDHERFSFVALADRNFIGCVSGLAYKNGNQFNGWCYITDLFVEKEYRRQGLGVQLLQALEKILRQHGIDKIYTWTAGYEAPDFYKKQGYTIFAELENWYSTGHSQIGLRKKMEF